MDRNIPECCSKLTAHKTPPCATTGPRTQDPGPSCSSVLRPDAFTGIQLKRNYNFLFVELLHASQHLWDKKPQCSLWGDTMFCPGCRSTLCVHSCSAFFSWTQLQTLTVSTGERLLTQECGQEFVREFYEAERRFWLAFDLWVFDLREIDLWACVCAVHSPRGTQLVLLRRVSWTWWFPDLDLGLSVPSHCLSSLSLLTTPW